MHASQRGSKPAAANMPNADGSHLYHNEDSSIKMQPATTARSGAYAAPCTPSAEVDLRRASAWACGYTC